MSRFTDYKSIVDLEIKNWDDHAIGYSPDCSQDMIDYEKYDNDLCMYVVQDVAGLIEYAKDWERYETEDDANSDYSERDYNKAHGIERVAFIYPYDKFLVREQYRSDWCISNDPVVDLPEIVRLAKEWDTPVIDLLDQCDWIDSDSRKE